MPVSPDNICDYLAFLHTQHSGVSKMSSALTAIAWRHKTLNLLDPTKDHNIKRMMVTYQRNAPAVKRAAPLSLTLLTLCVDKIDLLHLSHYDSTLLKAILLLCYYGCTRIGELCLSNNLENVLKAKCVEFVKTKQENHFQFTLLKYKLSKGPKTLAFKEDRAAKYCPVEALRKYAGIRPVRGETFFA